jgi:hypothetical protein
VLVALVSADPKRHSGERFFVADVAEWEPRAACPLCGVQRRLACAICGTSLAGRRSLATTCSTKCRRELSRRRRGRDCKRCDGSGYIGEKRPPGEMLAWDVAWSDEGHLRIVGPRTPRRKGEALFKPHLCAVSGLLTAA